MAGKAKSREERFILWFSEIGKDDVALVGGKNASLGEMYNNLSSLGVKVPNGFAVTTGAYKHFLSQAKIKEALEGILGEINSDLSNLDYVSTRARRLILSKSLPDDLRREIGRAYGKLEEEFGVREPLSSRLDVAVRSSAISEDGEESSFAGQLETFLNVRGEEEVIDATLACFASNFTMRVIDYRERIGLHDHLNILVSAGVQKMVRSDKASSGIAFTVDTNTGFKDVVIINAGWGLGELIVGGQTNPDEYIVSKTMLKQGFHPIIGHTVVKKDTKLVYAFSEAMTTAIVPVPKRDQLKPALDNDEILQIALWSAYIEDHYGMPVDIEWAKDGVSGELFIVQARPATGVKKPSLDFNEYLLDEKVSEKILEGVSVGDKIVTGKVNMIESFEHLGEFKEGEILVTHMTTPSWEPAMRKAVAMVTNDGGRKCHAAIIAAEEGMPCVVGTGSATEILQDGQEVTIDCSQGEIGFVYDGFIPFHTEKVSFGGFRWPKTDLMLFGNKPLGIFAKSHIPSKGVGLARTELIVGEILKSVHPMAWVKYPNIPDEVKEVVDGCAAHYRDKPQYFVDKLAEAWGRIGAAFYPRPVIMRFSDFKSNEYADLLGGKEFEFLNEANPMIGLRGAARYLHPGYSEAFRLECAGVKKAREEFGFKNIIPMIPFCRTPGEGRKVIALMKEYGLEQGADGLEIYVMIEIPSNIFLADRFADIFDGFSIGSNDLTQLIYGVDRDSGELAELVDESDEGIQRAISGVIGVAHSRGKKIGICGEAPSYLMDFTRFLVKCGIDSITITSGSLGTYKKTAEAIKQFEEELGIK